MPVGLEKSALIDGCTRSQALIRVTLRWRAPASSVAIYKLGLEHRNMPVSTKQVVRRLLEHLVDYYGYELKEKLKPLRRCDRFLSYVRAKGFYPKNIIDVGVGDGTDWLYKSFPRAYLILIEANPRFLPSIEFILRQYVGEYYITAVGDKTASGVIKVNPIHLYSSGLLNLSDDYREKLIRYGILEQEYAMQVPMVTLDSLNFGRLEPPILIKLDIEGLEIDALKGGRNLLRRTDMVIAELSVAKRFEGGASCGEFLAFMEACDFAMFDVVDLGQLGANGPLVSMDVAFLRQSSWLWSSG